MEKKEKTSLVKPLLLMVLLGGVLLVISLTLSTGIFNSEIFRSYFKSPKLLMLNFIPIFIFMLVLYLVSNRLSLSFVLTSIVIIVGGVGNRAKIMYRDDPLVMMDLKLLNEARMMSERYAIPINTRIIATIVGLIIIAIIVKIFFDYKIDNKKIRLVSLGGILVFSGFGYKNIYLNQDVYDKIGDKTVIDQWIESQRHQSKGFIYPFLFSGKDLMEEKPEGYSKKLAKENLDKFEYENIPEGKKVNVISIMLEAYNDFSKFPGLKIQNGVYDDFHKLQEESIHGNLVTNIFAGGTVDTERAFLTGYQYQPKYNKETNSFVWYFKEQGYKTEAMHPITGSFYNRRNVNEHIGFDEFYHGDNKYTDAELEDKNFLPSIIQGFEEAKKENKPYFNFSLTYQNHGPYAKEKYHEVDYLERKPEYDEGLYNIANNYLYGVKDTGEELSKMIDYFRNQDEPVVVVLFGDHNPWLGEQNAVYKMLGIDLDLGTEQGFRNYYETPYIIWGNDAAREIAGNDLQGQRDEIGSCYLMAQMFEELGYVGNPYMQSLMDIKSKVPVQHNLFFKEDGKYKKDLDKYNDDYSHFKIGEFYYSRNKDKD